MSYVHVVVGKSTSVAVAGEVEKNRKTEAKGYDFIYSNFVRNVRPLTYKEKNHG